MTNFIIVSCIVLLAIGIFRAGYNMGRKDALESIIIFNKAYQGANTQKEEKKEGI